MLWYSDKNYLQRPTHLLSIILLHGSAGLLASVEYIRGWRATVAVPLRTLLLLLLRGFMVPACISIQIQDSIAVIGQPGLLSNAVSPQPIIRGGFTLARVGFLK